MPEAAMDEDSFMSAAEDEVGRAGQVTVVQAKSETHRMDEATDEHLRLAIAPSHLRHASAPFCRGKSVH
jgi:hypothetical protein